MKNLKKKKSLNIVLIEECPELTSMLTKAVYCLGHSLISFSTPIEAIKELPNLNYIDAIIADDYLNDISINYEKKLAGIFLVDKLLEIKKVPILIWSYSFEEYIIKKYTNITLVKKPKENIKYIFEWLDKIEKTTHQLTEDLPIYQLIYSSKAVKNLSEYDLINILNTAREFNRNSKISGALIFHNGLFLQILEGDKNIVEDLFYKHICNDIRHYDLVIFSKRIAISRQFRDWDMGFFGKENDGFELLGFTDFDTHPAGNFFNENLTESQKKLFGII